VFGIASRGNGNFAAAVRVAVAPAIDGASRTDVRTLPWSPPRCGRSTFAERHLDSTADKWGNGPDTNKNWGVGVAIARRGSPTGWFGLALMLYSLAALPAIAGGDFLRAVAEQTNAPRAVGSTTTAFTTAPNPSYYAQPVVLNASVTPATASGSVSFFEGPALVGSGTLVGGVATTSVATLNAGTHSLTAVYGGDGSHTGSTSSPVSQVVLPTSTTTSITSWPDPSIFGQPVTVVASVTPSLASGSVTFYDGGTTLAVIPLIGGVASTTVSTLSAGQHSIGAHYNGDANTFTSWSPNLLQDVYAVPAFTSAAAATFTAGVPGYFLVTATGYPSVSMNIVQGSLPPGVLLSTLNNGTGTIYGTTQLAGTYAFTIQAFNGLYPSAQQAFTLTVAPGAPAKLTPVGGAGQSARVGTTFAQALAVKANDAFGNAIPSTPVSWSGPAIGAGVQFAAPTSTTNASGLATMPITANAIAGTYVATANLGALNVNFSLGNTITVTAGNGCGFIGPTDQDLVEQYYAAILRRPSDAAGKAYWMSEADRVCALGVDPKQTFFLLGNTFFNSPEYLAFNRDDTAFVTDLYVTFFSRLPDAGGLSYWQGQIGAGMTRNNVMGSFLFSPEFTATMNSVFPGRTARAETYLTMNLYGGFFRRLADSSGYNFWDGRFRSAQCQANPASTVTATVDTVSGLFLTSPEYANRATSDSQFIDDLYYAMLQRGGDLSGFNFWVGQLKTISRGQVRQQFLTSPEMQARSTAIAAQGCLP
jgi:hypothetical protein